MMLKQISETNACEEIDFNVFVWENICKKKTNKKHF